MIKRKVQDEMFQLLAEFPAVALLGPRQVGKTTLAKELGSFESQNLRYFDLEDDEDMARMQNASFIFAQYADSCVILDEVQRMPDLFRLLRPVIDANRSPGRFILTGSASPTLVKGVSESLAGRIAYLELSPINLIEALDSGIGAAQHWFRGGFPTALTAKTDAAFSRWAEHFIRAYIERDLSLLFGASLSEVIIRNFWYMLAGNNGSIWSAEGYARALGISSPTVKRYLDFLEGAYMVRSLPAWFVNAEKRVVKSPKVYIRDSGLLHEMNRIRSSADLPMHLIVGSSWEGYVIEQVYQLRPKHLGLYYYRTHNGAECDLILVDGLKPVAAIEIKYALSPTLTKGFYQVLADLNIEKAFVITPGDKHYNLDDTTMISGLEFFLRNFLPGL